MNSTCLAVSNGMVCYDGTTAGSVATYSCDDGYMLRGSAERVCGSDGHWEERIPSCEIIGRIVHMHLRRNTDSIILCYYSSTMGGSSACDQCHSLGHMPCRRRHQHTSVNLSGTQDFKE